MTRMSPTTSRSSSFRRSTREASRADARARVRAAGAVVLAAVEGKLPAPVTDSPPADRDDANELPQRLRRLVLDVVELIADADGQRKYQAAVPYVHVPSEL